jgi:hypothetical protein
MGLLLLMLFYWLRLMENKVCAVLSPDIRGYSCVHLAITLKILRLKNALSKA